MTKEQYLDKLYYEIGNMNAEQKDEILSIFVEHFEQGLLDGKTEDEICEDLGDPASVAAQFLNNNRDRLNGLNNSESLPVADYKQNSGTYREWTNDVKAQYLDDQIKKKINCELVKSVNVDMKNSDIKIRSCEGKEFTVTIDGRNKNSKYEIYVSDGVLNVIEERKFVLLNLINFHRPVQTEIYVPRDYMGTLRISNKAGGINIEGIEVQRAELSSTAGDIRINEFTGSLDIRSTAGESKLNGIQGSVDLYSTAGDITIENTEGNIKTFSTAGNIKILNNRGHISSTTTAGNIKIIADEIWGLKATSSAGNVKAEVWRIAGDINLSSSAGNVKLEAKEIAGSIVAKTSMGNVSLMLPRGAAFNILSRSLSKNKSRNELINDPKSPYILDVSTSLGDVSIKTWS